MREGAVGSEAAMMACACAYALAQGLLVFYSGHRYLTLWRWWRDRAARKAAPGDDGGAAATPVPESGWPAVTVQLPVYDEPAVITRLIDAAAGLDYPPGRLEIQVLDDSNDETHALAVAAAERHRARGVDVVVLHRDRRAGFKAGALAAGLARSRGELIAVFDADFVPPRDFLRRLVPRFSDPAVGMVQGRWGHLNRDRSPLTAAQAVMLDSHFLLEHDTRRASGLFFNFNGSAGLWRRACIEDAGGWSHDTLTEDLDLSYRAQLRGWRFDFDPAVRAPAELPGDIGALLSQQRRWAKGSIQTARKVLPAVWRSDLPARVKLEAFVHLTSNAAYPLLLALGVLLIPVTWGTLPAAPATLIAIQVVVVLLGVAPVTLFLALGQALDGRRRGAIVRDVAAALLLGAGLAVNNTRAVVEGLGGAVGDWQRTPKTGEMDGRLGQGRGRSGPRVGTVELAWAVGFAVAALWALRSGHGAATPFVAMLAAGLGWVGLASLRARHEVPGD